MQELQLQLEELRKKALTATGVSVGFLAVGFVSFIIAAPVGFLLFAVGIILMATWARKAQKAFADLYKQNIVRAALCEVFEDVSFFPSQGISEETVESTGMMYTADRFTSNDLVTARYKDVPFTQSDVHIEERHRDSDGDTHYTTVFRGRWMIFRFNKEFSCDLQVVSSGFSGSRRKGGLFSFFTPKEEKMHKVELENQVFNKAFKVYAQNQHEAFYILTPHIMDALLQLRASSDSPLMLMFVNGELHVAAETNRDAFEPSLWKKPDIDRDRENILRDINVITAFADALRLENDIYKK